MKKEVQINTEMDMKDRQFLNLCKKERIRKVFSIYSQKSSVSGVSFITGSKYTSVRICWTLLLLIAVLAMTVQLVLLFVQYFAYQKQSVTDLDFSILPFPAITFCNVNPIRKSQVDLASPTLSKLVKSFDPAKLNLLRREFVEPIKPLINEQVAFSMSGDLPVYVESELHYLNNSDNNQTDFSTLSPPITTTPEEDKKTTTDDNKLHEDVFDPTSDLGDFNPFGEGTDSLLQGIDLDDFLDSGWDDDKGTENDGNGFGAEFGAQLGEGPNEIKVKATKTPKQTSVSTFSKLYSVFRILYSAEPADVRQKMGHALKDLLIYCVFAGNKCNPSDFNYVPSNTYGNCYTLQLSDFMVAKDGPPSGLQLILYLELDEYNRGFTPSTGIQVVVHQPDTIPFPEDEGFSLSAGAHTMVGLKMHDISRLGYPYGDCSDVENFKEKYGVVYTRQTCQKLCEATNVIDNCGCFDTNGGSLANLLNVSLNSLKPCKSNEERICAKDTQLNITHNNQRACLCSNPCKEKKYVKTISSRPWPDEEYARIFINHVCEREHRKSTCYKLQNEKGSRLREEFLQLSIFYEDLNYEHLKEVPNYKLVQLVSDIGGTIGLWIGLSLLSVFELFHLVFSLIVAMCAPTLKDTYNGKKRNRIDSSEAAF